MKEILVSNIGCLHVQLVLLAQLNLPPDDPLRLQDPPVLHAVQLSRVEDDDREGRGKRLVAELLGAVRGQEDRDHDDHDHKEDYGYDDDHNDPDGQEDHDDHDAHLGAVGRGEPAVDGRHQNIRLTEELGHTEKLGPGQRTELGKDFCPGSDSSTMLQ